jgi:photosystem II stability/assembly factor-like uncharacterized protein
MAQCDSMVPMKPQITSPTRFLFLIYFGWVFLTAGVAAAEDKSSSDWHAQTLPFRVLNATDIGQSLWVCGIDETLAMSSDAGEHWHIKHEVADGAVLLNVGFVNPKFGYSAGTGGLILTTEDGGETWSRHSAAKDAILQVSFSDDKHGLIRTFSSLLFTVDGGTSWALVSAGQNSEDIKHFPYTFSLVALDSRHMAVMMKEGSAQYSGGRFLVTEDSGKTWKFVAIPNTNLYSFLRVSDKYWTVGTEVIHKDQPGGGYDVPVALYSSDGEKWEHSGNDLSSCKKQMCVACTGMGCLSANGIITDVFSDNASYQEFPESRELTSKWAENGSAICFVAKGLQCAPLKPALKPSPGELPLPTAVGPGPLGAPLTKGPHCLICSIDPVLIDKNAPGGMDRFHIDRNPPSTYVIRLKLEIAKNGVVKAAVADDAPTPEVKSRIEQQAEEWIFEPYLKDGVSVNVKLNTSVRVTVLRAQ